MKDYTIASTHAVLLETYGLATFDWRGFLSRCGSSTLPTYNLSFTAFLLFTSFCHPVELCCKAIFYTTNSYVIDSEAFENNLVNSS